MDDDEFSLASTLRRALEQCLDGLEYVDEIDIEELARELASRAESHFGM